MIFYLIGTHRLHGCLLQRAHSNKLLHYCNKKTAADAAAVKNNNYYKR
jgi:hypothetical protein